MKRNSYIQQLFTMTIVLLLTIACDNEEVNQPTTGIQFTTSIFETKAANLWSQNGFNDGWRDTEIPPEVGIYAYRHSNLNVPFMGNASGPLKLKHDGLSSWYYEPLQQWPVNDKVDFYGYAPIGAEGLEVEKANYKNRHPLTFTVQKEPEKQVDLLLAVPNIGLEDGRVTMTFRHALSKILFAARLHDDFPVGLSIEIKKITLTNIYTKGERESIEADVLMADDGWKILEDDPPGSFDLETSSGHLVKERIEKGKTYDLSTKRGALLILPQKIKENVQEVKVEYNVFMEGISDPVTHDITMVISDFTDKNYRQWRHNEKTIYTILFHADGVKLSVFGLPGSPGPQ